MFPALRRKTTVQILILILILADFSAWSLAIEW